MFACTYTCIYLNAHLARERSFCFFSELPVDLPSLSGIITKLEREAINTESIGERKRKDLETGEYNNINT